MHTLGVSHILSGVGHLCDVKETLVARATSSVDSRQKTWRHTYPTAWCNVMCSLSWKLYNNK